MRPNPQFPVDLIRFTEEIFNGKLHFLCSDSWRVYWLERREKRTNQFIANSIIGLILCSIVGKLSSKTEEKY